MVRFELGSGEDRGEQLQDEVVRGSGPSEREKPSGQAGGEAGGQVSWSPREEGVSGGWDLLGKAFGRGGDRGKIIGDVC